VIRIGKRTKIKGQNYVLEFVLLSFIGIMVIVGIFMLHRTAIKPIYNTNIDTQMRIIENKIHLSEQIFDKYDVDKGVFIIEIPKKINHDNYYITSDGYKSIIIKSGNDVFIRDLSDIVNSDLKVNGVIDSSKGEMIVEYNDSVIILSQTR